VENIEMQVETATVRVLKEVFGVGEATVFNVVGAEVATVERVLDAGEDNTEELTTKMDETSREEIHLGSN